MLREHSVSQFLWSLEAVWFLNPPSLKHTLMKLFPPLSDGPFRGRPMLTPLPFPKAYGQGPTVLG